MAKKEKEQNGKTFYMNMERFEKLKEKAYKLTIAKKEVVKVSAIMNRLIDEFLEDCTELYLEEIKNGKKKLIKHFESR